jgi:hypothetical protein
VAAAECGFDRFVKLLDTFSVLERSLQFQATDVTALSNVQVHVFLSQPRISLTARVLLAILRPD